MKRICILLITVALIAGTVGCNGDGGGVIEYNLAIASTEGGSVTIPGEGMFAYDEGTVVNLVATPDTGYRFVNWTGDVGTIGDAETGTTSVTMNGSYFIAANFVAVYDLTIDSTTWGAVTMPGEGTFSYDTDMVVCLNATPDTGFQFAKWTGDVTTIADIHDASTTITMNGDYSIRADFWKYPPMVEAGNGYTVGLKGDGTVIAVGSNYYGQCEVGDWSNIAQVAASSGHTVGLKSNGTVVAVGRNDYEQCEVDGWADIVQVAAGHGHTVGLKSDGTVVAVGSNDDGQCEVEGAILY